MKMIRQLIFLMTILTLFRCSIIDNEISGHWHSTTPGFGTFKTLDIDDSVTIINKFEIDYNGFAPFLRKDPKTGKLYLPFQEYTIVETYNIDNDTLSITDYGFSYKYVKSDIKDCELADRYTNSAINISLSESSEAEDYDKLLYTGNLFTGTSIKSEFNRPKSTSDSIFVQANDVFITLEVLPRYYKQVKSEFSPNETIDFVIHADNHVDEIFIKRLLKDIPKTFKIYRAVKMHGKLGVIRINAD